jgi:hypothetical protein
LNLPLVVLYVELHDGVRIDEAKSRDRSLDGDLGRLVEGGQPVVRDGQGARRQKQHEPVDECPHRALLPVSTHRPNSRT